MKKIVVSKIYERDWEKVKARDPTEEDLIPVEPHKTQWEQEKISLLWLLLKQPFIRPLECSRIIYKLGKVIMFRDKTETVGLVIAIIFMIIRAFKVKVPKSAEIVVIPVIVSIWELIENLVGEAKDEKAKDSKKEEKEGE